MASPAPALLLAQFSLPLPYPTLPNPIPGVPAAALRPSPRRCRCMRPRVNNPPRERAPCSCAGWSMALPILPSLVPPTTAALVTGLTHPARITSRRPSPAHASQVVAPARPTHRKSPPPTSPRIASRLHRPAHASQVASAARPTHRESPPQPVHRKTPPQYGPHITSCLRSTARASQVAASAQSTHRKSPPPHGPRILFTRFRHKKNVFFLVYPIYKDNHINVHIL